MLVVVGTLQVYDFDVPCQQSAVVLSRSALELLSKHASCKTLGGDAPWPEVVMWSLQRTRSMAKFVPRCMLLMVSLSIADIFVLGSFFSGRSGELF